MSNVQVHPVSIKASSVGDFLETRMMMAVPLDYDEYDLLDLHEAELGALQWTEVQSDFLTAGLTTSIQTAHDAEEAMEGRTTPARESLYELEHLLELERMRPSCMPSDNKENVDPEAAVFLR